VGFWDRAPVRHAAVKLDPAKGPWLMLMEGWHVQQFTLASAGAEVGDADDPGLQSEWNLPRGTESR
jgi:hypothetical protein